MNMTGIEALLIANVAALVGAVFAAGINFQKLSHLMKTSWDHEQRIRKIERDQNGYREVGARQQNAVV